MLSAITCLDEYARCLPALTLPMSRVQNSLTRECGIDWQMARLDLLDCELSGNKLFKLLPFLRQARMQGKTQLLGFGGMHSNHLHALAAAGKRFGFDVIAIVRGYASQSETATVLDLRDLGVDIRFADRATYSRRYQPSYLQELAEEFPQALVIPEGGAGAAGVEGARILASMLSSALGDRPCTIALAMGTGTTFIGLLTSGFLPARHELAGYSALQNAPSLRQQVMAALGGGKPLVPWHVTDEFCLGGFAKMNRELALFMLRFEREQGIPLDPVYTAKLCFAIEQQIKQGFFPAGARIVTLHTGGLQGRRGMQGVLDHYYCEEHEERYARYG